MLPDALRRHMPVADRWVFFNHAAISPLPDVAMDAIRQYITDRGTAGDRGLRRWEPHITEARERLARLINVPASAITFTRNTSFGLNLVANGLDWRPGDNVVVPHTEFVANVYVWRNLERKGVTVRFVPDRAGRIDPADVEAAMDERTRLLAVSFVEFQTGFRNDLAALKEICHRRGIPICVDAIQGLGVLALDAAALDLDFVAAGAQKFLLGPLGVGFLYVRPDWLSRLDRVITGWRATLDPDNYFDYGQPFREDALRYEEGALPEALIVAWNQSLRLLEEIGPATVEAHVRRLTDRLLEGIKRLGYEIITPHRTWRERSAIVSFRPRKPAAALVQALEEAGFIVSERGGAVRVSVHGYNTLDEVDAFRETLGRLDTL